MKFDPDAVQHWNLPVTCLKPREAQARVAEVVERGDPTDPSVEAVILVRRVPILVQDFYRGRSG
jgi:hypothetical protein